MCIYPGVCCLNGECDHEKSPPACRNWVSGVGCQGQNCCTRKRPYCIRKDTGILGCVGPEDIGKWPAWNGTTKSYSPDTALPSGCSPANLACRESGLGTDGNSGKGSGWGLAEKLGLGLGIASSIITIIWMFRRWTKGHWC